MSSCPECGAAVRTDAPWCSLCYHDLRAPALVEAVVAAPAAAAAQPEPAAPVAAVPAAAPAQSEPAEPGPAGPVDAAGDPVPATDAERELTWPCTRCGTDNPLAEMMCTVCGASFLADIAEEGGVHLTLPLIGDVTRFPKPVLYLLSLGVAVAVALILGGLTQLL